MLVIIKGAGDLASGIGPVLQVNDSLAFAFRKFGESLAEQIPVLDDCGNLQGVLALKDVLKYNLPMDLVENDDFTALKELKPFAELIVKADSVKVSEIMSREFETVSEDTPAGMLVKRFLSTNDTGILVVDSEGRLRGEVKFRDFCGKVFWE